MSKDFPVLITSSVTPQDNTVRLKSARERLKHTLDALAEWRQIAPHSPIIVCDGSGFDFSAYLDSLCGSVPHEALCFQNDIDLVKLYGKGYGEGEIIRYALQNSSLLRRFESFVKCTAKLWVANYPRIVSEYREPLKISGYFSNVFNLKKTIYSYIDTRFYIVQKEFYQRHFLDAHLLDLGDRKLGLEYQFKAALSKTQLQSYLFRHPLIMQGVSGGSGHHSKTGIRKRIKNELRNFLVMRNPRFRNLFQV